MRLPRRLTIIAAVGCLAVTVAGCGGRTEPAPKPSSSSTGNGAGSKAAPAPSNAGGHQSENAPPSPRTKVKKPERSDYARISERSSAGASAALQYFIDGYRYGLLTGDPSAVEDFSTTDCDSCRNMIRDIKSEGVRLESAEWKSPDSVIEMTADDAAEGAHEISSRAVLVGRDRAQSEVFYMGAQMRWSNGVWHGYNISVEGE